MQFSTFQTKRVCLFLQLLGVGKLLCNFFCGGGCFWQRDGRIEGYITFPTLFWLYAFNKHSPRDRFTSSPALLFEYSLPVHISCQIGTTSFCPPVSAPFTPSWFLDIPLLAHYICPRSSFLETTLSLPSLMAPCPASPSSCFGPSPLLFRDTCTSRFETHLLVLTLPI